MRQRKKRIEAFSLSFLDCICCGFGAVILLLVLSRIYEPATFGSAEMDRSELRAIRGESKALDSELVSALEVTINAKTTLMELQRELQAVQGQYQLRTHDALELLNSEKELRVARQRLTEEMMRLQPLFRRAPNDAVGGIPVDSEYIVFVIDTSGSMRVKWDFLIQKLDEALDVYPTVQGLQIMNDNGTLMFPRHGRSWLQDTPQLRLAIKHRMRDWAPLSDSNPADGIIYALERFSDPAKKVSIYVFGDDFTGRSADAVVHDIDRINAADVDGNRPARIHAIGFATSLDTNRGAAMAQKYAGLMRVVTGRNGGAFVALTERDRR